MLDNIELLRSKTNEHSVLIVWLHGLGAPAEDFKFLADNMSLPENLGVKFILPQAPSQSVTLNGGMVMPAWYDIVGLDRNSPQDIDGALRSLKEIESIIQSEIDNASSSVKVFLGGFSQGGALALLIATRTSHNLSGVICCSGYLLQDATSASATNQIPKRKPPIFICHGEEDDVVKKEWGFKAYNDLKHQGFDVDWRSYALLGHSVSPTELNDISNFLKAKL